MTLLRRRWWWCHLVTSCVHAPSRSCFHASPITSISLEFQPVLACVDFSVFSFHFCNLILFCVAFLLLFTSTYHFLLRKFRKTCFDRLRFLRSRRRLCMGGCVCVCLCNQERQRENTYQSFLLGIHIIASRLMLMHRSGRTDTILSLRKYRRFLLIRFGTRRLLCFLDTTFFISSRTLFLECWTFSTFSPLKFLPILFCCCVVRGERISRTSRLHVSGTRLCND